MGEEDKIALKETLKAEIKQEIKQHTLLDRVLKLGGIIASICTTVTVFWAVTKFVFVAGGMYNEYKQDRILLVATAHKVDSAFAVTMDIKNEMLKHEVEDMNIHVVYDKVALRDSTLSGKEHDILRDDENRNIVTR